ncbi:MAG TPA: uroporphyrinogen decarboxylase family protein, partial [Candidatus Brocadiia bacterium]|nr:uroporphyrinogen decarboxylase family protein [Candidatus Brocadiia bacterium]
EAFGLDVASVATVPPPRKIDSTPWFKGRQLKEGCSFDLFGVAHEPGSLYHFTHFVSPLAGWPAEAIKDYELPDRAHPAAFDGAADRVKAIHAEGRASSGLVGHTYETAWEIRGLDQFLEEMVTNPEPIEELVERIAVQNCALAAGFAKAGVDVLRFGDDVANQNAMMFSPASWRRFFKDRLRRQIAAARAIKPDIHVWYHSDGNISAIIPELIEVGVDILNPVQPECLDLPFLKREYGGQLAFWGCIGTQSVMPFGKPADVRDAVVKTIETMGPGLLIAPTHVLEPDVPWENILALMEATQSYRY